MTKGVIKAVVALEEDNLARALLNDLALYRKFQPDRIYNKGWRWGPDDAIQKYNQGIIRRDRDDLIMKSLFLIVVRNYSQALRVFELEPENVLLVVGDDVNCRGSRIFSFSPERIRLPISVLRNGGAGFLQESHPGCLLGMDSAKKADKLRACKEIVAFCTKGPQKRSREF